MTMHNTCRGLYFLSSWAVQPCQGLAVPVSPLASRTKKICPWGSLSLCLSLPPSSLSLFSPPGSVCMKHHGPKDMDACVDADPTLTGLAALQEVTWLPSEAVAGHPGHRLSDAGTCDACTELTRQ